MLFMGASATHLDKLDAIQRTAQKLGRFEIESLESRCKAAAVSLALRMLEGDCKPGLSELTPELIDGDCVKHVYNTSYKGHMNSSLQLDPIVLHKCTLDSFRNSFLGAISSIWNELPSELIMLGRKTSWKGIIRKCKRFFKNHHDKLNTA